MNKHLHTPHGTAHLYRGGQGRAERRLGLALEAVRDIGDYADRGDVVGAEQARRLLDDLCSWWPDVETYPPAVAEALGARGLRATPRGARGAR